MKYYSRSKIYKASNVTFNAETCEAYSYGWWKFVARINGFVVFNNYRYSNSTSKHQSKVRSLMSELGIKIDLYVSTNCGLNGAERWVTTGLEATQRVGMVALKNEFNSILREQSRNYAVIFPQGHLFSNVEKIEQVFKVRLTQQQRADMIVELEEQLCDEFLTRSVKRQEKLEREAFQARARKLEQYLENDCAFRDYDVYSKVAFGERSDVAVHQVVDMESLEHDVQNALQSFSRDGFGKVVFYV